MKMQNVASHIFSATLLLVGVALVVGACSSKSHQDSAERGNTDQPGSDPAEGFADRKLWANRDKDPVSIQREFLGPKGRVLLMKWLPTRAYENGVYVVFTNPIGIDDDQIRNGNAMVIDPNGNVIAETHKLGDDVVIGCCNRDLVQNAVGRIFLSARRPELYGELVRPSATPTVTKVAWM